MPFDSSEIVIVLACISKTVVNVLSDCSLWLITLENLFNP